MPQIDEAVAKRIREVVSRAARLSEGEAALFQPDADLFRQLQVDSGTALEILLSLEDEFAVSIPDETFGNARSLRAIARLIVELQARK
jgi:acyl carrier protein